MRRFRPCAFSGHPPLKIHSCLRNFQHQGDASGIMILAWEPVAVGCLGSEYCTLAVLQYQKREEKNRRRRREASQLAISINTLDHNYFFSKSINNSVGILLHVQIDWPIIFGQLARGSPIS
eukprot:TCALIF_01581-PA protein Name:"Protein of unknown function" AED:0.73 eAED:1.00 QI:0/0/0/0.5/1/1/2/0/120